MEEFSQMIAAELKLPAHRIANTLKLLQGGATIPFISRYRKEATGGLDEVQIGDIQTRYEKLCELSKRKETVLSTIEEQGKLTPELKIVQTKGNRTFHHRGARETDSRAESPYFCLLECNRTGRYLPSLQAQTKNPSRGCTCQRTGTAGPLAHDAKGKQPCRQGTELRQRRSQRRRRCTERSTRYSG